MKHLQIFIVQGVKALDFGTKTYYFLWDKMYSSCVIFVQLFVILLIWWSLFLLSKPNISVFYMVFVGIVCHQGAVAVNFAFVFVIFSSFHTLFSAEERHLSS